jgi:hypothetical protein
VRASVQAQTQQQILQLQYLLLQQQLQTIQLQQRILTPSSKTRRHPHR